MVVKTLLETGKKVASTLAKKEIEKPVYVLKEGWDKANFKLSKKQSLTENLDALANRESAKIMEAAGKGVDLQFTKGGKPFVPAGTLPSKLIKAKGFAKIVAPAGAAHYLINKDEQDDKKPLTVEKSKRESKK